MTDVAADADQLKKDAENTVHTKLDAIKTDSKLSAEGFLVHVINWVKKETGLLQQELEYYL